MPHIMNDHGPSPLSLHHYSEFGRRVTQNASNGTDHGTANNVFLLSGALRKPGLLNAPATQLARVLQEPASQLARVIKAKAEKSA